MYAKDDLWVVSPTLAFGPDAMVCRSTFYGPSAAGEVHIHTCTCTCELLAHPSCTAGGA